MVWMAVLIDYIRRSQEMYIKSDPFPAKQRLLRRRNPASELLHPVVSDVSDVSDDSSEVAAYHVPVHRNISYIPQVVGDTMTLDEWLRGDNLDPLPES